LARAQGDRPDLGRQDHAVEDLVLVGDVVAQRHRHHAEGLGELAHGQVGYACLVGEPDGRAIVGGTSPTSSDGTLRPTHRVLTDLPNAARPDASGEGRTGARPSRFHLDGHLRVMPRSSPGRSVLGEQPHGTEELRWPPRTPRCRRTVAQGHLGRPRLGRRTPIHIPYDFGEPGAGRSVGSQEAIDVLRSY
jgi:hypothetical protein